MERVPDYNIFQVISTWMRVHDWEGQMRAICDRVCSCKH